MLYKYINNCIHYETIAVLVCSISMWHDAKKNRLARGYEGNLIYGGPAKPPPISHLDLFM